MKGSEAVGRIPAMFNKEDNVFTSCFLLLLFFFFFLFCFFFVFFFFVVVVFFFAHQVPFKYVLTLKGKNCGGTHCYGTQYKMVSNAQIVNEPAHDETYNKICVTSKDRSACTYTWYIKGSGLSLFG